MAEDLTSKKFSKLEKDWKVKQQLDPLIQIPQSILLCKETITKNQNFPPWSGAWSPLRGGPRLLQSDSLVMIGETQRWGLSMRLVSGLDSQPQRKIEGLEPFKLFNPPPPLLWPQTKKYTNTNLKNTNF